MACGVGDGAHAWQGLGWLVGWNKGMVELAVAITGGNYRLWAWQVGHVRLGVCVVQKRWGGCKLHGLCRLALLACGAVIGSKLSVGCGWQAEARRVRLAG